MNLLVIGADKQAVECRQKFGNSHRVEQAEHAEAAMPKIPSADVIFDFMTPSDATYGRIYPRELVCPVFFDASITRLSDVLIHLPWLRNQSFGFCGLPTLINRDLLEVSVPSGGEVVKLEEVCQKMGTAFRVVSDQAGMVTPRIICMIINEAFFTLEEGTASRADIDLAMKLGTNYPWGPFEWAVRIGLPNVVQVLTASYRDSGDERYQVCPLLLREAAEDRSSLR